MADSNVHITGSDPDWEVQKTLNQILGALEKTQKVTDEQKKVIANATKDGKIFDAGAIKKFSNGMKKVTVDTFRQGSANKNLFKTTQDLNKEFKESKKSIKGLAIGVGGLMSVLGYLWQSFNDTAGMFRNLTDQGLSYNMTYMQAQESLARMGMSLNELEGITQKYATAMGSMGLSKFTGMIEGIGEGFNKFGLTMAEGADWAGEYLQQQRLLANFSIYTQKGLNEAVRSNIERLTAFSKILNISRSEIQAAQTEAASDLRVRARFLVEGERMHKDAEENFTTMVGNLTGLGMGDLAKTLTEMMSFTDGQWAMSEAYQEIMGSAAAPIGQLLGEIVDTMSYQGMSEAQRNEYMLKLGQELQGFMATGKELQQAGGMTPALEGLFKAGLAFTEAQTRGTLTPDGSVNDTVATMAKLNQNLNRIVNTIPFLLSSAVEKVLEALGISDGTAEGAVTDAMDLVATKAGELATWLMKIAKGEIEWKTVIKDWGVALWEGIQGGFKAIFDGGVALITKAINEVAEAIRNWSPFNKKHSVDLNQIDKQIARLNGGALPPGIAKGSLGENAIQLQEARKFLAGAVANVEQARANYERTGDQKYKEHLDRKLEEYVDIAKVIQELYHIRRAIYTQTAVTEEVNG